MSNRIHTSDCKVNAYWEQDRRCDCEPRYTLDEIIDKVRAANWMGPVDREDLIEWLKGVLP